MSKASIGMLATKIVFDDVGVMDPLDIQFIANFGVSKAELAEIAFGRGCVGNNR